MPMPRLTSIPERSSWAMRSAITVCASIASLLISHEVINDGGRRHHVVGRDDAYWYDVVGRYKDCIGRHCDHWIEVTRG